MNQVAVSSDAVHMMRQECRSRPNVETGGILIAHIEGVGPDMMASDLHATGPGPKAIHSPYNFSPDVAHCNAELARRKRIDARRRYVGTWHRHLDNMPEPSTGDLEQARRILNDPDYGLDFIIVIIVSGPALDVNAFYLRRDMVAFRPLRIEFVEQAGQAPMANPVLTEVQRLNDAGWQTETRRIASGLTIVTAKRTADAAISFFTPPTPSNAQPEILVQTRVPWPTGKTHLDEAAAAITGEHALSVSRWAAERLDALEHLGLHAQLLQIDGGNSVYAIARPGEPTLGYMKTDGITAQPLIYDRYLIEQQIPQGRTLKEWARSVRRRLVRAPAVPWRAILLMALVFVTVLAIVLLVSWGLGFFNVVDWLDLFDWLYPVH